LYCALELESEPRTSEETPPGCGSIRDEVLFNLRFIRITHDLSGQDISEVLFLAKIFICNVATNLTLILWE